MPLIDSHYSYSCSLWTLSDVVFLLSFREAAKDGGTALFIFMQSHGFDGVIVAVYKWSLLTVAHLSLGTLLLGSTGEMDCAFLPPQLSMISVFFSTSSRQLCVKDAQRTIIV